MKKIKLLAVVVITFFTINAAHAQVGVHVGLNFGAPYHRVYAPAPAYGYYAPAYYGPRVVYRPAYGPRYYPAYGFRPYYRPYVRHGFYRPYRRW